MSEQLIRVDKIKWWLTKATDGTRLPVPLCPQHNLRLSRVRPKEYDSRYRRSVAISDGDAKKLKCEEGPHFFDLPRTFAEEKSYVINRWDSRVFAKMPVLNLDDEAVPVAKEELRNSDYWVRAKVTESKAGTRLVIWAGNKAKKNKTQLFVEPELKKLGFDQYDDHPNEVFSKVEATFAGGSIATIEQEKTKLQ